VSDDLHTPTTAAPTPGEQVGAAQPPASQPSTGEKILGSAPEPVTHAAQSAAAAAASARETVTGYAANAQSDRPELLAGAAFAGGVLAAMILKRLSR
jgi:hypothetical protein